MARKPRGLFLLFEGLPRTVIDSQVFANLRWLSRENIADCDVLTIACSRTTYEKSLERLDQVRGHAPGRVLLRRGIRQRLPGASSMHQALVRDALADPGVAYDFIHARTDYAAAVAGPIATDHCLPLIWDCRGDSIAEFRERRRSEVPGHLLTKFGVRALARHRELAARYSNKVIAVSNCLARTLNPLLQGKAVEIIPCLGDGEIFGFDPVLRTETRNRLGYAAEHRVYIYVGSMAAYQGFGLALSMFEQLFAFEPASRLLVLTPNIEDAEGQIAGRWPGCVDVRSVAFDKVNDYLTAADCAVMLRPDNATNQSAFPTKFAEYGLSGLPILMNRSVPDCWGFAEAAGNRISADNAKNVAARLAELRRLGSAERHRVTDLYRENLTRPAYAPAYRRLYA